MGGWGQWEESEKDCTEENTTHWPGVKNKISINIFLPQYQLLHTLTDNKRKTLARTFNDLKIPFIKSFFQLLFAVHLFIRKRPK